MFGLIRKYNDLKLMYNQVKECCDYWTDNYNNLKTKYDNELKIVSGLNKKIDQLKHELNVGKIIRSDLEGEVSYLKRSNDELATENTALKDKLIDKELALRDLFYTSIDDQDDQKLTQENQEMHRQLKEQDKTIYRLQHALDYYQQRTNLEKLSMVIISMNKKARKAIKQGYYLTFTQASFDQFINSLDGLTTEQINKLRDQIMTAQDQYIATAHYIGNPGSFKMFNVYDNYFNKIEKIIKAVLEDVR